MAEVAIKRRDAKTGNKRERTFRKLSAEELKAGQWTRGAGGSAHHFFIEGMSVCGRPQIFTDPREGMTRKLCPDCYAAFSRSTAQADILG